jgi:hypothetical protein
VKPGAVEGFSMKCFVHMCLSGVADELKKMPNSMELSPSREVIIVRFICELAFNKINLLERNLLFRKYCCE